LKKAPGPRMIERPIVGIDCNMPDKRLLARAVAVLERGGLVVAPTETRYGLLARADQGKILKKLFEVKKRSMTMPISIFVREISGIGNWGELNPVALMLARRFLPGPLTLVLRAVVPEQPGLVTDGKIGIRVSSSPVMQALLENMTFPLSATSANISGGPELESVTDVLSLLGDKVDLYLDGGPLTAMPSTVVDCSAGHPVILRQGSIGAEEIREVVGKKPA
jgi:L-threonylcarbamoyladenylate synthase